MSRSVICVVRSVGERTTDACVKALEAQTGQEPEVLGELSFRDTVRRCFTSALESGEPLLLTCDADVLPYAGCVDELLMLDRQVPQNYFQIVGDVDDHLFGRTRNGGLRLYRADWLERALRLLEHSDSVRPESGLILPMAKKGHPSAYSDAVLGLHAAHQSRSDVYRTAKFFAHKHAQSVAELAALWRTGGPESDFAVALEGLCAGLVDDAVGPDVGLRRGGRALVDNELPALSVADETEILNGLPPTLPSMRWATYPTPVTLHGRFDEFRRRGDSFAADTVARLLRRALRFVEPN